MESNTQIHDFLYKLRRRSTIEALNRYVSGQRRLRMLADDTELVSVEVPLISVNLDLSTACNHACYFCVDAEVINSGKFLSLDEIIRTIDTLVERGLRSIILIGGGEPTLHPGFVQTVRRIKDCGLQLGIVTNGTRPERILEVADRLSAPDWIRLSLDAATDATYQAIHNPRGKGNSLDSVLRPIRDVKARAPSATIGYSFVVCWSGLAFEGTQLPDNIDEIPLAAELAAEHGFDYLSLKPCLEKKPDHGVETLALHESPAVLLETCERIQRNVDEARERVGGRISIHPSINLSAMMTGRVAELRQQPRTCHVGFFRQVISPLGVYHCPAFRGDSIARIADRTGYATHDSAEQSSGATARRLLSYDAKEGCRNIACLYNAANRAIEELIEANDFHELDCVPDGDCFL